jgi:peptidoglycan/LPS O-acetylase OafA/YrhL
MPPPPTKPHFQILDGLRGVAAILVVIYHLFEPYHYLDPHGHPEAHGYLAVDFFFLLSGFVVGYAYDDRWGRMSRWEFFKIRLVRLHPMAILGVTIGAIMFYFDPFANNMEHVTIWKLLLTFLVSLTLLPSPDLRGWGETHTLNGPAWSLFQEYLANIIYAFLPKKKSFTVLWTIVVAAAIALIWTATWRGDVGTGWSYETFWIAFVRMMFPFFAGLLLFRTGKLIHIPMAFPLCALALVVLFFLPSFTHNGLYEALCVIIAFPLIVAAGAGGQVNGTWAKISSFAGKISYPIYITHYPFIYLYTEWVVGTKPAPAIGVPVAVGLFIFFIVLAYAALKLYDEPFRARLKKKYIKSI